MAASTTLTQVPAAMDMTEPDSWTGVPELFRSGAGPLPPPWEAIFGPLRRGRADDLVVLGQLGQSLDGRIATATGHSKYINGAAGLDHLHRIRALVDGIVVGIGTALADDPQLTVRRVCGPNPARIVIDPRGRLPKTARLLWEAFGSTAAMRAASVEAVRERTGLGPARAGQVVAALQALSD